MPKFPSVQRLLRGAACLAAIALLAAATSLPAAAAAKDPEADLKRVRERIGELQRAVRKDVERRDGLAAELGRTEVRIAEARTELRAAREAVAASNARLRQLTAEREKTESTLVAERDALAAQLKAAYVNGAEEPLKLLLNQQDPAVLGRMLVYYSYFGRARAEKIGEIEQAVTRLAELAVDEAAAREELKGREAEAARQLAAVDRARADRATALAAVNRAIKGRSASLERLKREAAGLEKLVADLRKALARERLPEVKPPPGGQPFERVKGKLPWPVPGQIVANFGASRGGGMRWTGTLIATERGTQVRAPYTGRVVYADWLPGLGLLLILDHGGGYLSLYGHNEQLFKGVGDRVEPGDVIASVGDSGGRDRPELYVEIRRGTRPLDPKQWFRRR